MLEGTNLSQGRGTTKPFELFGAPWIDGFTLAKELNALNLAGVKFREVWFTPTFSKFKETLCGGCQLHVTDREAYQPIATTLAVLRVIKLRYPEKLEFHASYFDKVMGTSKVLQAIENGAPTEDIVATFKAGIEDFSRQRQQYLLYH